MKTGDYPLPTVLLVQHVARLFSKAGDEAAALPVSDLVKGFEFNSGDEARVRANEGADNPKAWAMRYALHVLGDQVQETPTGWVIANTGKDKGRLRWEGKLLPTDAMWRATEAETEKSRENDLRIVWENMQRATDLTRYQVKVGGRNRILTVHPYALKMPALPWAMFKRMAADLRDVGLEHAISVRKNERGLQIVDGHNRAALCEHLGIAVRLRGEDRALTDAQVGALVLSVNDSRRAALSKAARADFANQWLRADVQAKVDANGRAGKAKGGVMGGRGMDSSVQKPAPSYPDTEEPQSDDKGQFVHKGAQTADPDPDPEPPVAPPYPEFSGLRTDEAVVKAAGLEGEVSKHTVAGMAFVREHAPDIADKVQSGEIKTAAEAVRQAKQRTGEEPPVITLRANEKCIRNIVSESKKLLEPEPDGATDINAGHIERLEQAMDRQRQFIGRWRQQQS